MYEAPCTLPEKKSKSAAAAVGKWQDRWPDSPCRASALAGWLAALTLDISLLGLHTEGNLTFVLAISMHDYLITIQFRSHNISFVLRTYALREKHFQPAPGVCLRVPLIRACLRTAHAHRKLPPSFGHTIFQLLSSATDSLKNRASNSTVARNCADSTPLLSMRQTLMR